MSCREVRLAPPALWGVVLSAMVVLLSACSSVPPVAERGTGDLGMVIQRADGKVNVIVIDSSGVRMESSTCKNQICVHHGTIDPNNADELLLDHWIVCLPNGVSVEVTDAEGEG